MSEEQTKADQLTEVLDNEQKNSAQLQEALLIERARVEELSSQEQSSLQHLENLLSVEAEKNQLLVSAVEELKEEQNRFLQTADLEKDHAKKIEDLCEELKTKAATEKTERLRLEKIAERYHANLEEITKLFEAEKQRRVENEKALTEEKKHRTDAVEKGELDVLEHEKLREELQNAAGDVESLTNELERSRAKLSSCEAEIKSENAIKIAGKICVCWSCCFVCCSCLLHHHVLSSLRWFGTRWCQLLR